MIKLGFISDTHNKPSFQWSLEPCDIIVHSGDFSFRGTFSEIQQFIEDAKLAMQRTGAKHFIIVPGNHELGVQKDESFFRDLCKQNGITCLIHEAIELEGIKFFGTPWQPEFCSWAYNVWKTEDLEELYDQIPDDTDVLITHCPPYQVLDYSPMCGHVGSDELWRRVQKLLGKIKFHSFGHIHYSRGIKEILGTKFINAAILSDHYNLNPEDQRMMVLDYGPTEET